MSITNPIQQQQPHHHSRQLDRIAFNVDDFSIQYKHVGELSPEDLRRTSWLTEKWLYDFYKHATNDDTENPAVPTLRDFFILVSQDGQNATDAMNVVSFDAYVSFAASDESPTYDASEILAAPFLNEEANAQYARSLKLDMKSFQKVNLLLDPPIFDAMVVPSTYVSSTSSSRPISERTSSGGMSTWGKVFGGTAIGIIAVLHVGVVGLLLVRSVRRWRSAKSTNYEEYCSEKDEGEEEGSLSILVSPSKSPRTTFDASGAVFLGTIDEDTSFREPSSVSTDEENNDTGHTIA